MSDTFDHEGDAWDSYESNREDGGYYDEGFARRGTRKMVMDPLYYHTRVKFKRLVNTTDKAVQLELLDGREMWVPRSVCREWGDGTVYVHTRTLGVSLENARRPTDLLNLLDDEDRPF